MLVLGVFGVVMVASALAGNKLYASWPWRQAGFLAVGLILLLPAAAVDYRLLESVAYPIYIFFLTFLGVIAVDRHSGGRRAALAQAGRVPPPTIGTHQDRHDPGAGALSLPRAKRRWRASSRRWARSLLLAPAVVLIYLQPNLGTALTVW